MFTTNNKLKSFVVHYQIHITGPQNEERTETNLWIVAVVFRSSGCAFRVPSSSVLVEIENFRLLLLLDSEYHITYTMRLYNVHDVLYFIESLAMDNGRLKLQLTQKLNVAAFL